MTDHSTHHELMYQYMEGYNGNQEATVQAIAEFNKRMIMLLLAKAEDGDLKAINQIYDMLRLARADRAQMVKAMQTQGKAN